MGEIKPAQQLKQVLSLVSWESLSALVGISFIGKIIGSISVFLLTVVLARGFGPEVLGAFAVGFILLRFGGIFARLGFDTSVRKFIPEYHSADDEAGELGLVTVAIFTPIIFGCSLTIFLLFFQDQLPISLSTIENILLIGLPLQALMYVLIAVTQAYKNTIYSVYTRDLIHAALSVILTVIIVLLNYPAKIAAYAYVTTLGIAVLAGFYYTYRLVSPLSLLNIRFDLKKLYSYSTIAVFISVSNQFVVWSDILILGALASSGSTGRYQAAYQMSVTLSFLLIAVNTIFPTVISSRYAEQDWARIESVYISVTKWITYFTSIGAGILLIYPSVWLLLFGREFQQATVVLSVLVVSQWIGSSAGPAGKLLAMCGKERIEFWNAAVIGGVNLGLNIILVERYGILGAAFATAFSLSVLNLTRVVEIRHLFGISPHRRSHIRIAIPVVIIMGIIGGIRVFNGSSIISGFISVVLAMFAGIVGAKYLFSPTDRLLFEALQ